jgi:hypothetical protein
MQHRDNYFVLYLYRYKETGFSWSTSRNKGIRPLSQNLSN